jgi:hypothetical protein
MFGNSYLICLGFGPFEGSSVAIVAFYEFIDGMAQLSDTESWLPARLGGSRY